MKKSELKNRMVVEMRNGKRYIVVDDSLIGVEGFLYLSDYNDDLSLKDVFRFISSGDDLSTLDIVRAYDTVTYTQCLDHNSDNLKLLWERDRTIEVTIEDIEKKFGCPVKIVREKKRHICNNCYYFTCPIFKDPCKTCLTDERRPHWKEVKE